MQEPQQRISPNAVKVWRIKSAIECVIGFCILGVLLYLHNHYHWPNWTAVVLYALVVSALFYYAGEILFFPVYRQRTWRYEIDENYIQLKHGAWKKTHLMIPMTKVQFVNTRQGPLLRQYGLAAIEIGTMASTHKIPAIPEREAEELRSSIAFLAKVTESDEEIGVSLNNEQSS
ncbi:membrane protein YdbS with pleckstrin-like domain [Scopulibacillus daqui]|uniref:Membrane protein YdbS with pleckstrin-like domain n=2 Tax=Scopulibacillus daqui TaxID=1469162 RepID=A0ABS2PZZ1_9BACL|nr:PH domain-containing protein [Scopulibacillus daqui]MBM7645441.1 membrane protein YdbS with pleckstrin-like domain [Scopulibacillus daqui]